MVVVDNARQGLLEHGNLRSHTSFRQGSHRGRIGSSGNERLQHGPSRDAHNIGNKYPPAKPEVLRLLAPQRGLTAIAKSKPKTEKTTNDRLPELSNFVSPPAEPGVYHD